SWSECEQFRFGKAAGWACQSQCANDRPGSSEYGSGDACRFLLELGHGDVESASPNLVVQGSLPASESQDHVTWGTLVERRGLADLQFCAGQRPRTLGAHEATAHVPVMNKE